MDIDKLIQEAVKKIMTDGPRNGTAALDRTLRRFLREIYGSHSAQARNHAGDDQAFLR